MRSTSVQAWWVSIPIETARQHRSDYGTLTTFDAAMLRIETDDGPVGWGEGKNAAGSGGPRLTRSARSCKAASTPAGFSR